MRLVVPATHDTRSAHGSQTHLTKVFVDDVGGFSLVILLDVGSTAKVDVAGTARRSRRGRRISRRSTCNGTTHQSRQDIAQSTATRGDDTANAGQQRVNTRSKDIAGRGRGSIRRILTNRRRSGSGTGRIDLAPIGIDIYRLAFQERCVTVYSNRALFPVFVQGLPLRTCTRTTMRQIHGSTISIGACVHLRVSNIAEILVLRHIGVQNITRLQNAGIQNIVAAVAPDRSEVRIVDLFTRTCRHAFDTKRLLIDPANSRCTRSGTLIGVVRTTRVVSQLTDDACHPVHQCLLCLFGAGLTRRNTGILLALRVFLIGTEVHGTLTVSTRLEITNGCFGRINRILGVLD